MRLLRASLATLLIAIGLMTPSLVSAQGPLEITTPFPSVVADAGGTAKFTVTVTTDTAQRVDLSVGSQPDGWSTRLTGGGSTISAVTTAPNPDQPTQITAELTAEVTIPDTTTPGPYQVSLGARSAAGVTATLNLDITIEASTGEVTLNTDFPTQSGSATDDFTFNLNLRNGTNQQITFSFEPDNVPAGWRVTARPSTDDQATTAIIDAGGSSTIRVTVTPTSTAEARDYPITVRALGGPQPIEAQLGVTITGSFGLDLNTTDQRQSARVSAGSPTSLTLVITNSGSAPLESVALTSTPPRNWDVTFDLDTVPEILPGAQANVQATIQAAGDAIAGDYVVTIRAGNDDSNDEIQIRTTVETSPIGGLLGIAVLVLVGVGLFFVFQRYGRR